MNAPSTQSTVGELVIERPSRSRVFSKLGIDFCCGGKKSLADACQERSLDPAEVLAMLAADEPQPRSEWADAPLGALCDHIESTHHVFTKGELPRLSYLLRKVATVHGENFPYMVSVLGVFEPFADALLAHMHKEEAVLFPAIRALAARRATMEVSAPVAVMRAEHEEAGEALRQMRELTGGYVPPAEACNSFRAALAGLAELEDNLHEHVHLENNILFPGAIERES